MLVKLVKSNLYDHLMLVQVALDNGITYHFNKEQHSSENLKSIRLKRAKARLYDGLGSGPPQSSSNSVKILCVFKIVVLKGLTAIMP